MPPDDSTPWWKAVTPADLRNLRSEVLQLLTRRKLGTRSDLEDAVQEALVALLVNRRAVNPANDGLLRYTFVVARNRLLDRRRRRGAERLTGNEALAATDTPEETGQILRIFDELDPVDRYLLWRHVVDKVSVSQVAAEVGLYWHKAARRIDAALKRLRRGMRGQDD